MAFPHADVLESSHAFSLAMGYFSLRCLWINAKGIIDPGGICILLEPLKDFNAFKALRNKTLMQKLKTYLKSACPTFSSLAQILGGFAIKRTH